MMGFTLVETVTQPPASCELVEMPSVYLERHELERRVVFANGASWEWMQRK